MEKNGHWYTDKNGKHYFVENGQSPKEGWEASNRRKMLKNGKYNVSEDGVNYKEVGEDEYRKFEADEDFDIDDVDSVRDFDEEEVIDKGLSQKELDTQSHNAKIDKINKLYEQDKISKKEYHKMIDEEVDAFNELQKNWPIEEDLEGEEAVTDEDISQTLEDESWKTEDSEELAEIVAKQMNIDKDRVMSVINKEKDELWESEEDKLWDRYEKGEITDKEREKLNSERQKKLMKEEDTNPKKLLERWNNLQEEDNEDNIDEMNEIVNKIADNLTFKNDKIKEEWMNFTSWGDGDRWQKVTEEIIENGESKTLNDILDKEEVNEDEALIDHWLSSNGISKDSDLYKGMTPENKAFILKILKK